MFNPLTFAELVERAETFHAGAEDALVEKGAQTPLLVIFGERSGFVPYANVVGNILPREALTMAVKVFEGSALMLIGVARRATVLLNEHDRPIDAVSHRVLPGDLDRELWSIAVNLGGPTAINLVTPVYGLEDDPKVGERSREDVAVEDHFEARRLMAILNECR